MAAVLDIYNIYSHSSYRSYRHGPHGGEELYFTNTRMIYVKLTNLEHRDPTQGIVRCRSVRSQVPQQHAATPTTCTEYAPSARLAPRARLQVFRSGLTLSSQSLTRLLLLHSGMHAPCELRKGGA